MTNIVEQLFKSLDPWPGFQITSFKIQVSPVDGRKTLILDLRPVEGSMPICSRCRHEAPLVHGYVSRRIKERSLLGYFVELNVTLRRVDCLHCKPKEALQKPPLPSRMEQKCSVRLFLTTPECAVFCQYNSKILTL